MSYVDGYVIPVKTDKKADYHRMAEFAAGIFLEYGALEIVETWADEPRQGDVTDFTRAVQARPDESIVFSWVVWPSREVRENGNKLVENDPRCADIIKSEIFNAQRMIYSGFETIVHRRA